MDFYRFCFYLGFTGIASMAVLGMSHGAHGVTHAHGAGGHHAGGHGHTGHHGGHSHGHARGSHGHNHQGQSRGEEVNFTAHAAGSLMALFSPRFLFSVLLGCGATGILVRHAVPTEPWLFIGAACGGLGFERFLVGPVWNMAFRFASQPAHTLESAVAEEALAVSNFNAEGEGVVSVLLDGQSRQVLARLTPAARQSAVRVRSGDALFIESVDSNRNSCIVSLPRS